ncbi:hypothetical protein [Dinghuibacter silviterrae]|uniref:Zinc-finger domain-containing protein n=1 Tax=Dinghuibacter silviterrae TaxID=1539049 RepID=A0A4R8DTN2_9BACT|nr:hypothetical protein [Dinghuibacter silviterrae]TDX00777.1 hypothetical protein EDB95_1806 [Dinghuibacter silviterrae]
MSNEHTDPQKWLDYLDGKLPEEEARRLEAEIAKSEFLREALEGLRPFAGKGEALRKTTRELNQRLHQQLAPAKRARRTPLAVPLLWVVVALLVILAVILLGYYFYTRKG